MKKWSARSTSLYHSYTVGGGSESNSDETSPPVACRRKHCSSMHCAATTTIRETDLIVAFLVLETCFSPASKTCHKSNNITANKRPCVTFLVGAHKTSDASLWVALIILQVASCVKHGKWSVTTMSIAANLSWIIPCFCDSMENALSLVIVYLTPVSPSFCQRHLSVIATHRQHQCSHW